jgi:multicomponent Na+:H+ antiporter subunit E
VLTVVVLTLVWCGLWGELTVANIVGGVLLAVAITAAGVGLPGDGGVKLVPLTKLTGLVLVDLVRSTISVAKEILTPRQLADEAIIAVKAPAGSGQHLLLLIVLITLTPGTAVVDTSPDTGSDSGADATVFYLHLLYGGDAEQTRRHVAKLADLACQALPTSSSGTSA